MTDWRIKKVTNDHEQKTIAQQSLKSFSPGSGGVHRPSPGPCPRAGQSTQTLITNVQVFDGRADTLSDTTSVLIEGSTIKAIAPNLDAPADAVGSILLKDLGMPEDDVAELIRAFQRTDYALVRAAYEKV
jgi:hypothetical protein